MLNYAKKPAHTEQHYFQLHPKLIQLAVSPISKHILPKFFSLKKLSTSPNNRVAVLIYEGLCSFEFACAAEVFGLARPELGPHWYRFELVGLHAAGAKPGYVTGQYGQATKVSGGLKQLASAGTIIIPGWSGIDDAVPKTLISALLKAHLRGARILTICSGAFVLAATGLLDGKRAATHWRYAQALQLMYPNISVDANVLYVDEGQLLTSAGSAAGLDLALHLVRRDFGSAVANHVAKRLVIAPHRDGGQAQFISQPISQPRPKRSRDGLAPLLDQLRATLAQPQTIAQLALSVAMSERTFMRRFQEATGMTPINWLIQARVDKARELLETSAYSIDTIAEITGLGSANTLRHHFKKKLCVSPSAYKRQFQR